MHSAIKLQASDITEQNIYAQLNKIFSPTELFVTDESLQHTGHAGANALGYATHFRLRIASKLFLGLNRVRAHRLVYDALSDFFAAGLHALSIEIIQTEDS